MTKLLLILFAPALLWGACGTGSTSITAAQVAGQTARQLLVTFTIANPATATVDVFSDSACANEIADTNGSNAASRAGSIVSGSSVQFPVGHHTGNDSLSESTTYWIQISNSADASALTIQGTTAPIKTGNMYPEQPLPDQTKWDIRAYPNFNWATAHRNDKYVDPTTGAQVKLMSAPGDYDNVGPGVGGPLAPPIANDIITQNSGIWTNPGNAASSYDVTAYPTAPSSGYGTCTGTCDIWLAIPDLTITTPGFITFNGGTSSVFGPGYNLDFLVPYVWASATSGTPSMTVSLTQTPTGSAYHGCAFTANLTSIKAGYRSNDPDPGFANLCTTPPLKSDIAISKGTVNTSGTAVTWASGDYFPYSWVAGSYIKIGSSGFYQIASVTSGTALTLMTSAGTQTGAAYSSRVMGVRVQATVGAATLSLQVGYRFGISAGLQTEETLASGIQQCNSNPNAVTTSATGAALGFTLQGYVCLIGTTSNGTGEYFLVIPKDQNGTPDGEVRPLGNQTSNHGNITSTNFTLTAPVTSIEYVGPDEADGKTFYAWCGVTSGSNCGGGGGATGLLLKGVFGTPGSCVSAIWNTWCGAGQWPKHKDQEDNGGNPFDSPITYTILTATTGFDLRSQIVAAYSTFNPGFDLTPFQIGSVFYANGLFNVTMDSYDGQLGFFFIGATFNKTGTLTQVFDSFSAWPGRFCAVHGTLHLVGTAHSWSCNFVGPNATALGGPWQTPVSRVNLAGYGSATNWTSTTAIDNGATNAYTCPTAAQMIAAGTPTNIANYLVTIGSSGAHCIELEVTSEACSQNPSTGTIWQSGRTEIQQFPCPNNAAWSMLQTMQPGDQMMDTARGVGNEGFFLATKAIVSPGAVCTTGASGCTIDLWFIRGTGVWPNNVFSPYATLSAHGPGAWSLQATALFTSQTCGYIIGDSTASPHTWTPGTETLCASHGINTQGSSTLTANLLFGDTRNYSTFDLSSNISTLQGFPPWGAGCETCVLPNNTAFGGNAISLPGNFLQLYGDANCLIVPFCTASMYRPINPSFGSGQESVIGMGTSGYTLSAVGGTTQTYTITDPYSSGTADQKLVPLSFWAGAHMLQDYSGPSSVLPDSGYGGCRALQTGECVSGGVAGTTYVSVPVASTATQGVSNQTAQNFPVSVNPSSLTGRIVNVPFNPPGDTLGLRQQLLGYNLSGPGAQWEFSEPRVLPTGDWYMMGCQNKEGWYTGVCLFQKPAYVRDSINRTNYVNVPVQTGGASGDTVRVEFWYGEWGGVNGRAEHAFAPGATGHPFQWAFETATYTTCSSGCTINIPAISDYLTYYIVHRKNGGIDVPGSTQIAVAP